MWGVLQSVHYMQVTRRYVFVLSIYFFPEILPSSFIVFFLIEYTMPTKESNGKNFHNISTSARILILLKNLNFHTWLLKIYVSQQQQGISFQMIKIGLYQVRILDLMFCLWQIMVMYDHIYIFVYCTTITNINVTIVDFNNAAWLTLNLLEEKGGVHCTLPLNLNSRFATATAAIHASVYSYVHRTNQLSCMISAWSCYCRCPWA